MRCLAAMFAAVMFMALFAGCSASRSNVVLLQDPDGSVGKAEVSTEGGKRLLEKNGDMTVVSGKSAAPSTVTTADPAYISSTFSGALGAEPPPPEKFILYFESGGTGLVADSRAAIYDILAACKRLNALSISIVGNTDSVGSVELNDKLSRQRAEAVRDLLVKGGASADIMTVSSYGKANPLVPTPDGVAEPRNRRVEVIVR